MIRIFKTFVLIFCLVILIFSYLLSQEEPIITEKVLVKWWVIPFFAVDKTGKPVMDLDKDDIDLTFDKHKIKEFIVYKKQFYFTETTIEKTQTKPQRRYVFLLFDTALSTISTVNRSKVIAKRIVNESDENNYFILMSLEPYRGLTYFEGPTNNKDLILKSINKKISSKYNKFSISRNLNPQTVTDSSLREWKANRVIDNVRESGFFNSLRTLRYALKTIDDNKFVYMFAEGLRNIKAFGRGTISHYMFLLKNVAKLINQSGAVLFIINPSGAFESMVKSSSGEFSMRYLAEMSGGKYIEGKKEIVTQRINSINRAYYEIAFSDSPDFKGDVHKISVKANRKGIEIYSVRALSRGKDYKDMDEIEREILILNVVEKGYLAKSKLKLGKLYLIEKKSNKNQIAYKFRLPDNYLKKEIDLYKVWINRDKKDAKIEVVCLIPAKTEIFVNIKKKKGYKENIVVVNKSQSSALLKKL